MLTSSTIGMIRRRWASDRPFVGYTTESLQRKLARAPLSEEAKQHVSRELQLREFPARSQRSI